MWRSWRRRSRVTPSAPARCCRSTSRTPHAPSTWRSSEPMRRLARHDAHDRSASSYHLNLLFTTKIYANASGVNNLRSSPRGPRLGEVHVLGRGSRFRGDERASVQRKFWQNETTWRAAQPPAHRHLGNRVSALSRSILRRSESLKPNSPSPLLYSKPKRNGKSVPQRICEIGTILVKAERPGGCAICATS